MNRLEGEISKIIEGNGLSQVTISIGGNTDLKCLLLETASSASYLRLGVKRTVIFKETEVILAKANQTGISLQNKIPGIIQNIREDELLCEITVETKAGLVVGIIGSDAKIEMGLSIGEPITVMIKQNEIMLSE